MSRPIPPDPYEFLPALPTFSVTSADIADGERLPVNHASAILGVQGGQDVSPQLSWSGFPDDTKSFVVTTFDPDAPTASGFWHWSVCDIPADVTSLDTALGTVDRELPGGAFAVRNDAGFAGYVGAGPPAGHGPHRYYFVVHAVGTDALGVAPDASPAVVGFKLFSKAIARATLVATYEL